MGYTFCKQERLKSRKQIAALFKNKRTIGAYPLRIFWGERMSTANEYPVSIGFNVSKRVFKHAVDRNRYRRLMQEAFRLNKQALYDFLEAEDKQLNLMLIFVGKEGADYTTVERKFKKLIHKLINEIKSV
jgi:ribonuclease P protein component